MSYLEVFAGIICRLGMVHFVGIQDGCNFVPNLVLFNDPSTNTTLALPVRELSVNNIHRKIRESAKAFEQGLIAQGWTPGELEDATNFLEILYAK